MKNAITITAVLLSAIMFTSCRKGYTCTCTYADPAGVTQPPVIYNIGNETKNGAQKRCHVDGLHFSDPHTDTTLNTGWDCHI